MVDYLKLKCILSHSAKGSTWENHKYILRKNGTYYYPDSYEGGRHLPNQESLSPNTNKPSESSEKEDNSSLGSTDVENLAWEVIRGNFGSGSERRELLGEYYQQIQDRVNEIWKETGGTWRIGGESTPTPAQQAVEEAGEKAVEAAVAKVDTKGIDMSVIYSVYEKRGNNSSDRKSSSDLVKGGRNDRVK